MAFVRQIGGENIGQLLEPCRWLAGLLRGESSTDTGGAVSLERCAENPLALFLAHQSRAIAAAIFDDPVDLGRHSAATMTLLGTAPGTYPSAVAHLLRGLALAEQARASQGDEHDRVLSELDEATQWLAARAADAPDNFLHLLRLIEAERAWAVGDFGAAAHRVRCRPKGMWLSYQRPWHRHSSTQRTPRASISRTISSAQAMNYSPRPARGTSPGARPQRSPSSTGRIPPRAQPPTRWTVSAAVQSGELPDRQFHRYHGDDRSARAPVGVTGAELGDRPSTGCARGWPRCSAR